MADIKRVKISEDRKATISSLYKDIFIHYSNDTVIALTFDELEKLYHETKHYLNQQSSAILNELENLKPSNH